MTGKKVGRWFVESASGRKDGEVTWLCRCDCGSTAIIKGSALRSGRTQSCGCLRAEMLSQQKRTHGATGTPLYRLWKNIKTRCYIPSGRGYKNYGGRGIKMCDEWRDSFELFSKWALSNGYAEGLSIERIDVNGDYTPDNCTFIPINKQPVNRRSTLLTVNGITKPKQVWAKEKHMKLSTLSSRINKLGWSPEAAVLTPVRGTR